MPSTSRRSLLASAGAVLTALSGCTASLSPNSTEEDPDPHWVKMYLGDREETHYVTVTVTNEGGDVLFEKEYRLSDANEADEDATFPASTDPETVVVTVDGTRFERDWPGLEQPELPCNDANEVGVEIYVEKTQDGTPDIRLEADCQSISESEEERDRSDSTTNTVEGSSGIKIESSIEEELSVGLTITRKEASIHTAKIDVPPGDSVRAEYEITETGLYEIIIETDSGRDGSTEVHVDEYALEHGRDIVIAITSQMIHGYIQE